MLRIAPLLSELRRVAGRRPLPVSLDAIASPSRGVFVDPIERRPILGGKKRVLILCAHNSARSQMAEGLLRHLAEVGVDISGQKSKTLGRYLGEDFDYVVTVCDEANEACPFFPGAKNRLHWSLEDPAQATGSEEERLAVFRRVRDELREHIEQELVNEK